MKAISQTSIIVLTLFGTQLVAQDDGGDLFLSPINEQQAGRLIEAVIGSGELEVNDEERQIFQEFQVLENERNFLYMAGEYSKYLANPDGYHRFGIGYNGRPFPIDKAQIEKFHHTDPSLYERKRIIELQTENLSYLAGSFLHRRSEIAILANRRSLSKELGMVKPRLLSKRIQDRLELTTQQVLQLQKIKENYDTAIQDANREFYDLLHQIDCAKFDELCQQLSPNIARQIRSLWGEPIQWYRLIDSRHEWHKGDVSGLIKAIAREAESKERRTNSLLSKRIREDGIEVIKNEGLVVDRCWFQLMTKFAPLAYDPELTRFQEQELRTELDRMRRECYISNEFSNSRLEDLINNKTQPNRSIEEILLPVQNQWLRRAELQMRLTPYYETFGISHPLIIKYFEIGHTTIKPLQQIGDRFTKQYVDEGEKYWSNIQKLQMQFVTKSTAVLNAKQLQRYAAFTGQQPRNIKH